jgi:hypothetical protein
MPKYLGATLKPKPFKPGFDPSYPATETPPVPIERILDKFSGKFPKEQVIFPLK